MTTSTYAPHSASVVLILSFALHAGCGSSGGGGSEGSEPHPSDVPVALTSMEGEAEVAYDKALVTDLPGVKAAARAIAAGWSRFRVEVLRDGVDARTVDGMDAAVANLTVASNSPDRLTLARAANGVSAWMSDLFAVYNPPVPPAVIELDYRGREVVLDALTPDLPAAAADLRALDEIWLNLRSQVERAGGGATVLDFDADLVVVLEAVTAGDAGSIVVATNALLDRVDALEQVFSQ